MYVGGGPKSSSQRRGAATLPAAASSTATTAAITKPARRNVSIAESEDKIEIESENPLNKSLQKRGKISDR